MNKSLTYLLLIAALLATSTTFAADASFHIEEATISGTQKAIQEGRITCQGVVQAYINRIKAYNGQCTTARATPCAETSSMITLINTALIAWHRPALAPERTLASVAATERLMNRSTAMTTIEQAAIASVRPRWGGALCGVAPSVVNSMTRPAHTAMAEAMSLGEGHRRCSTDANDIANSSWVDINGWTAETDPIWRAVACTPLPTTLVSQPRPRPCCWSAGRRSTPR